MKDLRIGMRVRNARGGIRRVVWLGWQGAQQVAIAVPEADWAMNEKRSWHKPRRVENYREVRK